MILKNELPIRNEKINGIFDVLKLFFAIGVVGLHTRMNEVFPSTVSYLILKLWFQLAVPFFFIISGYFYSKKLFKCSCKSERIDVAISYCKRNLPPLIVFGGIGLFFSEIQEIMANGFNADCVKLVHDSMFYPLGGMWFVAASIFAAILIALLYEHKFILALISGGGYCFALICNSYYYIVARNPLLKHIVDLYRSYFGSARNGLFVGVPYFFCGVFLIRWLSQIFQNRSKLRAGVFVGSILGYIFEIFIWRDKTGIDDCSLYIFIPLVATMIIVLACSYDMPIDKDFSLKVRAGSKYLYFFHPLYIDFLMLFGQDVFSENHLMLFIGVFVLCCVTMLICQRQNMAISKLLGT